MIYLNEILALEKMEKELNKATTATSEKLFIDKLKNDENWSLEEIENLSNQKFDLSLNGIDLNRINHCMYCGNDNIYIIPYHTHISLECDCCESGMILYRSEES